MVQALQHRGHTVAMTGDGVNDVLALKDADCGVAMASGSEATRGVAQLVLMDSNFSAMPAVVAEGRRVINNIERVASLFLAKTTYSVILSVLTGVFALAYPLRPIHLSILSWFTIGLPAFFLALEPNDQRVSEGFLRRVLGRAVPAGVVIAVVDHERVRDRPARHVDRRRSRPHGRRAGRRFGGADEPLPRRPTAEPAARRVGDHDGRPVRAGVRHAVEPDLFELPAHRAVGVRRCSRLHRRGVAAARTRQSGRNALAPPIGSAAAASPEPQLDPSFGRKPCRSAAHACAAAGTSSTSASATSRVTSGCPTPTSHW